MSTDNDTGTGNDKRLPLSNLVRWMVWGEQGIAALLLFIILSTMATQVFARYVFGAPFSWSEEVARLSLIWLTFISAAFLMAQGRHIAVDMVSTRLGNRGKFLIECFSYIVVAATCLLLLIGGAKFIWYVGKVGSPALGVAKSWWYGAGGIGLLLMVLHSLINLYQVVVTGKPIPCENAMEEDALQLDLEEGQ
jgi:TRAP-type transport system small permease protein